ncbi:MAG: hypothetical protein U5L05_01490 [Rubrivivax sp.]|nr:hypothetical protein [Rubrivivax sp.]
MNTASAPFKPACLALLLAVGIAGWSSARACGYHDASSYHVGMLNWAYPDALHVRTAVWMAQRDGLLARSEPLPAADAASPDARLLLTMRLRATQARLDALRAALDATPAGRSVPAFAVVLIGPMLWTRFAATDGRMHMAFHAQGPISDDVVVVTDAPVLAALIDGKISFDSARANGLAKLYGSVEAVERVAAILDQALPAQHAPLTLYLDPAQKD